MNLSIETLFTTALGLQAPWAVKDIELNTAKRLIDFQVAYEAKRMVCPICGAADQGIHDRVARSWRHLDFFQYEAWLHAEVPRVQCSGCGKTTQMPVPLAREGSCFTLLFEALALSLCRELPVSQAVSLMRVAAKQLWTRIAHYVPLARAQDDMRGVRRIGVDETSAKKGHERFDGVVRGMLDGRSNAFVEAMNGLLQQTKTAARGFRATENFIAIAYLRMSKLKYLPDNPLVPAIPRSLGCNVHQI